MIPSESLPSWVELFGQLGFPELRRERARECPLCGTKNPTAFSVSERKGVFRCFVCGAGGDKVTFLQGVLKTDFKGVLRFLGLEPGKPPAVDPSLQAQRQCQDGLVIWATAMGRVLRDDFYAAEQIRAIAHDVLQDNPESDF